MRALRHGPNVLAMSTKKLWTYTEAIERLGMPRGTLSRLVMEQRIPHLRLGPRTVRFDPGDLDEWLTAHRVAGRRPGGAP